jgi:hypothetical protein
VDDAAMSLLQALAPYRVTTVRVPKAKANGLWRALVLEMRMSPFDERPIAFWGLPSALPSTQ